MKELTVAVVGVGSFGRHHVRHLTRHPLVRNVLVVDRDMVRSRAIAEEYGAEVAVSALGADAAVIAASTQAHAELALPLIASATPVLVEKPLAASNEEAAAILGAASRSGGLVAVGHIERFSPAVAELAARIGVPHRIEGRRHNTPRKTPIATDVVLDLMIHDIDLALMLTGCEVEAVDAMAVDDGHDAVAARLRFANGTVADLSASRLASQTERALTASAGSRQITADLLALTVTETWGGTVTHSTLPARDNLAVELDHFLRAAIGIGRVPVSAAAGAAALAVANRVREAARASVKLTA